MNEFEGIGEGTPIPATQIDRRRICLLVLGMHRSGTSALARVLSLMGAALPQDILGAGPGNESGHWEPRRLVKYHEGLLAKLGSQWDDWRTLDLSRLTVNLRDEIKSEIASILVAEYGEAPLIVVKDPRICRFASLFLEVLAEIGIDVMPILVHRNPLEVCDSLQRRRAFWSENRTRVDAVLLWLRH